MRLNTCSSVPNLSSWLLAFMSFAMLFTGAVAKSDTSKQRDDFPAAGHEYQVDFGEGNAFIIAFKSGGEMTFTRLREPNKGYVETIHFTHKKIRDGVYMVYWQEADKTTVVHVEDFARGVIYTNITRPDGTFVNGSSKLIKMMPPAQSPLHIEVYNPGEKAIFAVSSVLVSGAMEAVLIDTQFSSADARALAERIKASGKRLTTIYISHGDPDYYFGLDTLTAVFPDAKVLATPQTIAHIKATQADKLKAWGPQLGANAPKHIVIPEPLQGDRIELEGQTLQIIGLDGPTPDRTFVWIPSIRTVAGGIPVVAGEHVWMADTQTPQSHADWLKTLDRITALRPAVVIPGHYEASAPENLEAVRFTAEYLRRYDEQAAKAKNSAELIAAMKRLYPQLGGVPSLELGAKVSKGEMKWP